MNHADLAVVVDRALNGLPTPRAPLTLLPRVMSAVQAWRLRPWYRRAWFTWPVAAQAAMVAGLLVLASAAVVAFSMSESTAMNTLSAPIAVILGRATGVVQSIERTSGAARIVWDVLIQPVVPYLFGLVVLMSAACAALGAALKHVAFERT